MYIFLKLEFTLLSKKNLSVDNELARNAAWIFPRKYIGLRRRLTTSVNLIYTQPRA